LGEEKDAFIGTALTPDAEEFDRVKAENKRLREWRDEALDALKQCCAALKEKP
jgi:hypothetical protein